MNHRLAPSSYDKISGYSREQLFSRVQVLKCSKIKFQWVLKINDRVLKSSVEDSRAALEVNSDAGVLEAYVVSSDDFLDGGYTPIELSDELSKFFRITDESDDRLLAKFMSVRDHKVIQEDLNCRRQQRKGLRQPLCKLIFLLAARKPGSNSTDI